jgi:hypothetical protein
MRSSIPALLALVISVAGCRAAGAAADAASSDKAGSSIAATPAPAGSPPAADPAQPPKPPAPTPVKVLTPELKASILAAMRLNRQAFQETAVLARYGEKRPPATHPAFVACDLPRTSAGEPASQYPAVKARTTKRVYPEARIVDCLDTRGGLDGTRAKPLAQHYYCGLPGFSPDIRGCFTFQLRLSSVSTERSAIDDDGYLPDGTKLKLRKAWNFLGPDPTKVPDPAAAFAFCATDGRPHEITNVATRKTIPVATIHPTPTRPTCWIAQTQAPIFQGLLGGVIDLPIADQVAILKEYYECSRIKGKVSNARFKALCEIDVSEFK